MQPRPGGGAVNTTKDLSFTNYAQKPYRPLLLRNMSKLLRAHDEQPAAKPAI